MYLVRIFNQLYLNTDPPRRPWSKRARKVSRVRRVGGVDFMISIISTGQVIMINYGRYGHDLRRLIATDMEEQGKQCELRCHSVPSFLWVAIIHDWAWMSIWWKKTWRRSGRKHTRQVCAVPGVTRCCVVGNFFSSNSSMYKWHIIRIAMNCLNSIKYYAIKILLKFSYKIVL